MIAGTGFNKIVVEKLAAPRGKVSITNNTALTNVSKTDISLGTQKQSALKFIFESKIAYEPKIATILIEGELLWVDKPEKIDEIEKSWKKDKKVPKEVMTAILNQAMTKANIEALILSREMGLPPPIQLPRVVEK